MAHATHSGRSGAQRKYRAFTLVELLIVIGIIGILMVALVSSLGGTPTRARDTARKNQLNNLRGSLESFQLENGRFPAELGSGDGRNCLHLETGSQLATLAAQYLEGSIPKDPKVSTLNCGTGTVQDQLFWYRSNGGKGYVLGAALEVAGSGNILGTRNALVAGYFGDTAVALTDAGLNLIKGYVTEQAGGDPSAAKGNYYVVTGG